MAVHKALSPERIAVEIERQRAFMVANPKLCKAIKKKVKK